MATFISHSPAETEVLGEQWGRNATPGLVIGLSGDLGAGKTQLVKGLARGLGIPARVHSPSFTLVNTYAGGRLPLYHLDLYRLENTRQIIEAGLEEYLSPEGVTVIEWAERWFGTPAASERRDMNNANVARIPVPRTLLPMHFLSVQIETVSETKRRVTYEDAGH